MLSAQMEIQLSQLYQIIKTEMLVYITAENITIIS